MRLIDAEELMYELDEQVYMQVDDFSIIEKVVRASPTIEAKPVVHAHWEEIANGFMVCSHCKESVEENRKYSYFPICGAQMDEVVVEENATTTNNTQKNER